MPQSIKQIFAILTPKERRNLFGVLAAMLAMGVAQMAGVGVVLPFMALLTKPDIVHSNAIFEWFYTTLGFGSTHGFLMFTGGVLLVVLIASNVVTALTIWAMTRFSWSVQKRISTRLLSSYLHQPYAAFLNRNSADIGKNILIESQQFASGVLMPQLKMLAFAITAAMIIGFLFWLKPLVALAVIVIFGGAYLLIYLTIRRFLLRIGSDRMTANTERFRAVSEAFGSVKEVKVLNRENRFLERYEPAATTYADTAVQQQVLGVIPSYAIQGLAFTIVMGAMLYMLAGQGDLLAALPLASAFIVGGYRLLPALQSIYQGFAQLRFNQSVLDTLQNDLSANEPNGMHGPPVNAKTTDSVLRESHGIDKLAFEHVLELRDLSYRYPGASSPSLNSVSLAIRRNTFVAFTGTTGAGKTTLVDVILGLLEPSEGEIVIDGEALTHRNRSQWQANLGYVPQEIYLTDSSVASNIAYGLPADQIDQQAVQRAARIANIDEFITTELPGGYDTIVGERGVRLSGGQRQRIGIARALYHDPSVIVLDEATSALDNETERRIVNELDAMRGGRTLIVIAHRLTTVQKCHEVFLLSDGRIAAHGNFDELVRHNKSFRRLANANDAEPSGKGVREEVHYGSNY